MSIGFSCSLLTHDMVQIIISSASSPATPSSCRNAIAKGKKTIETLAENHNTSPLQNTGAFLGKTQFTMAGPARPASAIPARRSNLRQPTRRAGSAVPERHASPAVSTRTATTPATGISRVTNPSPDQSSTASAGKRKERDYEREINEDTSIHVVVRCRGRNREGEEAGGDDGPLVRIPEQ